MKMYELSQIYINILESDLPEDVLKDTLESVEEEFSLKAENLVKFIRNMEGDILALKDEEKRLADRRKGIESKVNTLKEYLHHEMTITGIKKVNSTLFNISVAKNPPSANIVNEALIPSEYLKFREPDIDKKEILKQLKSGVEIQGAELVEGKTSLRIK